MQQGYFNLFAKDKWREYKPADYDKLKEKKTLGLECLVFQKM
jgi:hypothetical protein